MKTIRLLILSALLSPMTNLAYALETDYFAYLRGGTGSTTYGSKQECFNNAGMPGNFLRLANECSFYSELGFTFNHVKATATDPFFFKTVLRLQFAAQGNRQLEKSTNRDFNHTEAFVQAGGLAEIPGSLWVGKRMYRDADLSIFDWYYYADMSGVGAGIEDIPMGTGTFAVAHLIQATDDASTKPVTARPALQALDLRAKNIDLGSEHKINFWGVYAWAPRGTDNAGAEIVKTNGYSFGSRLSSKLFEGNNSFALLYGKGAMRGLNIYGDIQVNATNDNQNRAHTWRVVNDWSRDVSEKWSLAVALAGEKSDNGASSDSAKNWIAFGVRPTYFVTDRFQWVFETGFSRLNDKSEKNGNGDFVGERSLGRVTLGPQISISKSMWGRPVMRAFVSHSFWNSANQKSVALNGAPTFADKTEGTILGYQFEVWF